MAAVNRAATAHGPADLHRNALEAARVPQLTSENRILELLDGMPVNRWRAWLREESLLPRVIGSATPLLR
jgi:hypothetical protein